MIHVILTFALIFLVYGSVIGKEDVSSFVQMKPWLLAAGIILVFIAMSISGDASAWED